MGPREAIEGNELERVAADVQEVVYAISHDLRAPTRHVRSFLQLLVDRNGERFDDVSVGYVHRIEEAAGVLEEKLDALTRYARVISRGGELVPCDASAALAEAVADLGPRVEAAGATIEAGPLPWVIADPGQLATVFAELIDNSVKFGPRPAVVRVASVPSGDRHLLSVVDDGPGFGGHDPSAAFDLFRRFHPRGVPGTGAGLAIVRRIVERHGGRVEIRSGAAAGAAIEFSLRGADDPTDPTGR